MARDVGGEQFESDWFKKGDGSIVLCGRCVRGDQKATLCPSAFSTSG